MSNPQSGTGFKMQIKMGVPPRPPPPPPPLTGHIPPPPPLRAPIPPPPVVVDKFTSDERAAAANTKESHVAKLSSSSSPSGAMALKRPSPSATSSSKNVECKAPKLAISLNASKLAPTQPPTLAPAKVSEVVKSVFNDSSDSEPEEIPEEYRIRMRNKGRDNPVACGPNSYGKARGLGFCDLRLIQERELAEKARQLGDEEEQQQQ